MTWRQKIIDERYNGNANRFNDDYAETVKEGCLFAVRWEDLTANTTILPELKETGRGLIKLSLGYLPSNTTLMPFEPYLRVLIQNYWSGLIAEDDFLEQSEDHIKLIRNADMRYNTCLSYDASIYDNYHKTFVPYGYAVRSRLSSFLGYIPELDHSLIAEMWMRDIMSDDTYHLLEEITSDDMRAMTLVKYREVLLQNGQEAADLSPLISMK